MSDSPSSSALFLRVIHFFGKPWKEQKRSVTFRYLRWIPKALLPVRLPIGAWWLAENDFIGNSLLWEGFENSEYGIAGVLVQPGMTVLDIGAHKGFYSLLFSKRVCSTGRVLSFEPSSRERKRLLQHLHLNKCNNVKVFPVALAQSEGEATLFVVDGSESGLNSLRPPSDSVHTHAETVRVRSLDDVLLESSVSRVDFVKIDVEGAERTVLSGAQRLLTSRPRPVFLAEVSDVRTRQWGYPAVEILDELRRHGYHWFRILPDKRLAPIDNQSVIYDDNFVAIPEEKLPELGSFLSSRATGSVFASPPNSDDRPSSS